MNSTIKDVIESDQKRRKFYSEQKKRFEAFQALIDMQQSIIELGRVIEPPDMIKREINDLNTYRKALECLREKYKEHLEREIGFITERTSRPLTYDPVIIVKDLDFLEEHADFSDEIIYNRLEKYFLELLDSPDENIKNRVREKIKM